MLLDSCGTVGTHPEPLGAADDLDLVLASALGVVPNARSARPAGSHTCFCDDLECPHGHPLRAAAFAARSAEERGALVERYTSERQSYGERHRRRLEEAVLAALHDKPGGRDGRLAKNLRKEMKAKQLFVNSSNGAVSAALERLEERGEVQCLGFDLLQRERWTLPDHAEPFPGGKQTLKASKQKKKGAGGGLKKLTKKQKKAIRKMETGQKLDPSQKKVLKKVDPARVRKVREQIRQGSAINKVAKKQKK